MELEEEIAELEKRFAEAPESRLFLPLADALARAGEFKRALELCRKGLETYHGFSAARVLMARCLAELDRGEEAASLFEEIISADPGNFLALKSLGTLAQERGDTGQAFSLYRKAYVLDGEDEELSQAIAGLEQDLAGREDQPREQEDSSGALAQVETPRLEDDLTFDREQPGEVFITHTLADIYRLQGHFDRARRIYEKLLEEDPENEALSHTLAEIGSRPGKPEPAAAPPAGRESAPVEEEFLPADEGPAEETMELEEPLAPGPAGGTAAEDELTGRVAEIFNQLLGGEDYGGPAAGADGSTQSWGAQPEEYLESLERWLGDIYKPEAR
ncbi:MAG: tetratricopeptide repeat protein [Candidatus Glassbacteria bacterium]|nr:tetratricopeptide repeat protein [Candidatus Glassbacteria bacterium]